MRAVTRISIHPSVVFKTVADELVLLDFDRGVYYGLNEVGARVWGELASGRTPAEAIERLLEEYDVERAELERDVEQLVADLTRHGLLIEEP